MSELADAHEVVRTYDCKEPNCDQSAKSAVGRYSYCEHHQTVRAQVRVEEKVEAQRQHGSPLVRIGEALRRIASFTNVRRTRDEHIVRVEVNGDGGDLMRRMEANAARLEAVATKLETSLR